MNFRLLINLCLSLLVVSMYSCSKLEQDLVEQDNKEIVKVGNLSAKSDNQILDLMLKASNDQNVVQAMHKETLASLSVGLEESVYFNEVLSNDASTRVVSEKSILKSFINSNFALNENTFRSTNFKIDDVEIYWPYSEDWDGKTQPVIVFNSNDENQYIEDDKTYAYKFVENETSYTVDTLIVDENYAEKNPVWVINQNNISLNDIINLKNGNYASTNYIPHQENNPVTRTTSSYVSTLTIKSIQATVQHDSWLDGGSEYIIFWGFPADKVFKPGECSFNQ